MMAALNEYASIVQVLRDRDAPEDWKDSAVANAYVYDVRGTMMRDRRWCS